MENRSRFGSRLTTSRWPPTWTASTGVPAAGRGQHLRAVSGMDVDPVGGHAAGAVPLPEVAVVKHLPAIDLASVEDGDRVDGDIGAGVHWYLLTVLQRLRTA